MSEHRRHAEAKRRAKINFPNKAPNKTREPAWEKRTNMSLTEGWYINVGVVTQQNVAPYGVTSPSGFTFWKQKEAGWEFVQKWLDMSNESISVSLLTYSLTYLLHGAESLRSQSRNSPHFMEPEGSLPHSQVPATCPYPEPARSSPCPHPTSWRSFLILFFHLRLGPPSDLFPSGFPTKTLYAPLFSALERVLSLPVDTSLLYSHRHIQPYKICTLPVHYHIYVWHTWCGY